MYFVLDLDLNLHTKWIRNTVPDLDLNTKWIRNTVPGLDLHTKWILKAVIITCTLTRSPGRSSILGQ